MMDDLISRRDAINAVSEITTTMSVCTNKDECYGMKRMQKQALTELENLPSAEPEVISKWKKEFREYVGSLDIARDDWKGIIEYIDELPSVQPERKTGRWIPDNTDYYRTRFICSVCGESEEVPTMGFGYAPMWGYCPNCGADMRGEENETD